MPRPPRPQDEPPPLSRRERQILDIVYAMESATAADVQARLSDPPSDSAVRSSLRILEEKGHLRHKQEGARYVYRPTVTRGKARRTALKHLLNTYFDGSAEELLSALVDVEKPTDEELERLQAKLDARRPEAAG